MAKPKSPKDSWVASRVDTPFREEVDAYIEASEIDNIGELIRKSLKEYMTNHPVKTKLEVPEHLKLKPGE